MSGDRTFPGSAAEIEVEPRSSPPAVLETECFHPDHCRLRLERYQRRLRALALELSLAAQRERRRIAVGLHDRIGQNLAFARLKIEALRRDVSRAADTAAIDDVIEVLGTTIEAVRGLTFDLSPPLLYEFGLEAALGRLAEDVGSHHGIASRLECDEAPKPLPADSAVVVYEVVRELLHNVVKHAHARNVSTVVTRAGDSLRVEVADDGTGFVPRHESVPFDSDVGFGLFSARERVLQIGGTLAVESDVDRGTRAVVTVPLGPRNENSQ